MTEKRGKFITFEGSDGAGKSTQVALAAEYLRRKGQSVTVTREPGGTERAEALREWVKTPCGEEIEPLAELLVMEAARVQHVEKVIKKALAEGTWVLCDRFCDSTAAYQGYGRMMDTALVKLLNEKAMAGAVPDRTVILTLSEAEKASRVKKRSGGADRFDSENAAFKKRVDDGFAAIAAAEQERVRMIDASGTAEEVHEKIKKVLDELV